MSCKVLDGEVAGGVYKIDSIPRDGVLFRLGGFCTANVERFVDRNGIYRDTCTTQPLRDRDTDCRFTNRRWAGEGPAVRDVGNRCHCQLDRKELCCRWASRELEGLLTSGAD